jgi:hypothetical protein
MARRRARRPATRYSGGTPLSRPGMRLATWLVIVGVALLTLILIVTMLPT